MTLTTLILCLLGSLVLSAAASAGALATHH